MTRLLLTGLLALTMTACGSEEPEEPASISETAASIEPMPAAGADGGTLADAPRPSTSGATVVDRVAETGDLTTLRRLLRESGVVEDLAAEGPFTLFAPSDAAFAAAGDLPSDPEAVRALLLAHALPFRVPSADLDIEQSVGSVGGPELNLAPGSPPTVSRGGTRATIVRADLDATNGVLHVIDSVLR
ncbi:MAG TPA: fasciclin domain-containing protein [Bacteroidetes bacterium]|nr:fasciclin domain-containing protein [Bacteroidota bacterium]HIL56584.1 fasciclin domain-containing protein [Rhodothermales bacterium]